jgi:Nuclease-related domain
MTQPTRSPIKDKPLRLPGQSLREERTELLWDKIGFPFFMAAFFLMLSGWEWVAELRQAPRSPWVVTIAALLAALFAAWRFIRLRSRFRDLRQGEEGERAVGQFLERLRETGYQVFHDVIGFNANIDHVLIGSAGIFTIETKTWSKPVRGDARVSFDGERVLVGGHEPDRNPVVQARAQANWLKQLEESTGRKIDVFPVVLFPGWFVEPMPRALDGVRHVWLLEPKALPAFLAQEPARLNPEDAKLVAYHLSRFIRNLERERSR